MAVLASTVKGETNSHPTSILLIPGNSVPWRNFFLSQQLFMQKLFTRT